MFHARISTIFSPDYNLTGDNVVLFKLRKIVFVNNLIEHHHRSYIMLDIFVQSEKVKQWKA
jgi:hypothetical protein